MIIPVRNESNRIGTLLGQLKSLSYPNFEVIVVDDHSNDDTASLVETLSRDDDRFSLIKNQGTGKKQATDHGYQATPGILSSLRPMVIAKCSRCGLQESAEYFHDVNTKMVFGGVSIQATTFFGHLRGEA